MNTNEERFKRKHKPRSYMEWYLTPYRISHAVCWFCLSYSALASVKFYKYLLEDYLTDHAIYVAVVISIGIAVIIYFLSDHVIRLKIEQNAFDAMLFFLLVALAANFYADFKGSPEIAYHLHNEPINKDAKIQQSRIDSLSKRINAIYFKYRWCPEHKSMHISCPNLQVPTSMGAIKNTAARYGHTPKLDREEIQRLLKEKQTYDEALKAANNEYNKRKGRYDERIQLSKSTLKGGVVASTLLYLFLSIWQMQFSFNVYQQLKQEDSKTPNDEKDENTDLTEKEAEIALRLLNEHQEVFEQLIKKGGGVNGVEKPKKEKAASSSGGDVAPKQKPQQESVTPAVTDVTPGVTELKLGDTIELNIQANGFSSTCIQCGASMIKDRKEAKFCSQKCKTAYHRKKSKLETT